jgi:hypothetical protein
MLADERCVRLFAKARSRCENVRSFSLLVTIPDGLKPYFSTISKAEATCCLLLTSVDRMVSRARAKTCSGNKENFASPHIDR